MDALLSLLVVLSIFGIIAYLFNVLIPLPEPWRTAINVVLALVLLFILLGFVGIGPGLHPIRLR